MTLAVHAALQVLGYGELPEAEVPDENIWHHPSRLEEWWDAVKQRREHGMEPVEAPDEAMTQNELTKGLRQ